MDNNKHRFYFERKKKVKPREMSTRRKRMKVVIGQFGEMFVFTSKYDVLAIFGCRAIATTRRASVMKKKINIMT